MNTDDKVRITLKNGSTVDTELRVYRIPSMYHPDDPELDTLGLYVEGGGTSRCVTVNRRHKTWAGTYEAIVRFIHEFCDGKLGCDVDSFEVITEM